MADISSGVSKLSLNTGKANAPKTKKAAAVADSWEDEDSDSGSEVEDALDKANKLLSSKETLNPGTAAPPPTPITPNYNTRPFPPPEPTFTGSIGYGGNDNLQGEKARPEKTDAVARRMIASALGVKVPKQTEEQKAYDRAMKEKERKRREEEKLREKQREEEAAKAKAAVWDD